MSEKDQLKEQIRKAFALVEYPGDRCLRGSNEGDEPYLVEQEFKGKTDWRNLNPEFIDQSPGGLASALSFFSDEAFHFYLPAYLLADVEAKLKRSEPVFHLTHGLDDASRRKRINPQRYGERTWFDYKSSKFSLFNQVEATAIVAYLRFKADADRFGLKTINQALRNYWINRAGEPPAGRNAK